MLYFLLFVGIVCLYQRVACEGEKEDDDFGGGLVAELTADRNLDLSVDDEYEDLRAELLAYHTVLANMVPAGPGAIGDSEAVPVATPSPAGGGRRAFATPPCWQRGGVCMLKTLCIGPQYLTEVRGCRDNYNVCCFGWNRYFVRDFSHLGIGNMAVGNIPQEYGGKGVVLKKIKNQKPDKKKKKRKTRKSVAVIIKNTSEK